MDDLTALEQLDRRLNDERHVVACVLFKLTVTTLVPANHPRLAAEARSEVSHAIGMLRSLVLGRGLALRDTAEHWQLSPDALSFGALAERTPAPYSVMLREHAQAFESLAEQMEAIVHAHAELAGLEHLSEMVRAFTAASGGEGADTRALSRGSGEPKDQTERIGNEASLRVLAAAVPPSLESFVR